MREAYYHEDDFCQVELLPIDNLQHCLAQMGEQQAFAAAHQSGAGWTDMYMRQEPPSRLVTLGITGEQLRLAVQAELPPYDAVFTGYSSYRVECRNVLAFGAVHYPSVTGDTWAALLTARRNAQLEELLVN